MSTGMRDVRSLKASCSCRHRDPLNLFSIVDLSAFEHDATIEASLRSFPCHARTDAPDVPEDDNSTIMSVSTTSSSTLPQADRTPLDATNLRAMAPAKIPDFIEVYPEETSPTTTSSTVLRALYQLGADILTLNISVVDYYESLSIASVELSPSMPPRGHVDGGALASTSNRQDYFWSYHEFTEDERRRVLNLRVADNAIYRPTGYGYLCIPRSKTQDHHYVTAYYTPEIPATILSPHTIGKALSC